jgi:uncharacterized protein YrrD
MAKPDKIFASELLERELMDLRAGAVVGSVADFCVTRDGRITLIGILPEEWYRGGQGIAPGQVTHVTEDRISIDDGGSLEPFHPDNDQLFSTVYGDNVYGKEVLRQDGELLGVLVDFSFSFGDGRISDIAVIGETEQRQLIAIEQVHTIGRNYIVVTLADASATEVGEPGPNVAAASTETSAWTSMSSASSQAVAEESSSVLTYAEPLAPIQAAAESAVEAPPARWEEHAPVAEEPAPPPPGIDDDPVLRALSGFDRKKIEYLLGRPAHRELRSAEGVLIAERGASIDPAVLSALVSSGQLNAVFLETTSLKS